MILNGQEISHALDLLEIYNLIYAYVNDLIQDAKCKIILTSIIDFLKNFIIIFIDHR
jgi:hypothetical protein